MSLAFHRTRRFSSTTERRTSMRRASLGSLRFALNLPFNSRRNSLASVFLCCLAQPPIRLLASVLSNQVLHDSRNCHHDIGNRGRALHHGSIRSPTRETLPL